MRASIHRPIKVPVTSAVEPPRVSPIVDQVLRSPGQPLDAETRAFFEPRFGRDFAKVRIHTDEAAAASTRRVDAAAYTFGSNIVFGAGEYALQTTDGRKLLAHELAHVVQQEKQVSGAHEHAAEADANLAASQVAEGHSVTVRAGATGAIQRQTFLGDDRLARDRGVRYGEYAASMHISLIKGLNSTHLSPAEREGYIQGYIRYTASRRELKAQYDEAIAAFPSEGESKGAVPSWVAAFAGGPQASPSLPATQVHSPPSVHSRHTGGSTGQTPPASLRSHVEGEGGIVPKGIPPGIYNLPRRRKKIRVVEIAVPEAKIGPFGSTRMFSQADVGRQYSTEITEPDPTAGYNFDTYIANTSTGQRIPAQWVGGTQFRVFMGTRECPGCHFGQGLVVDLHGEPFLMALAETAMTAATLSDVGAMLESRSAMMTPRPLVRTPEIEFEEFQSMLREEGATGTLQSEDPFSMQPHGGAREARQQLGVTGSQQQSAHGLPRSVGRNIPGYDPNAALTTLQDTALHTEMDQPWKDAFQNMRRQGRTTASAREIYNEVANSIDQSSQLSSSMKTSMKARLQDEMFVEYELNPSDQLTLPYRNIRPRP